MAVKYPAWYNYVPDHEGITALSRGKEMQRGMLKIAEEGAGIARATAPKRSGEYVESIDVRPLAVMAGLPNHREFRAGAMIIADSDHAFAVEVLYKGGHRTLRNAARAIQRQYGSSGGGGAM